MAEYDSLARIYDAWACADRAVAGTLEYYTNLCRERGCPVVELGVGTGRIAVAVAQQCGVSVFGVDVSSEMLRLCRERAAANGVGHLVTTMECDFRSLALNQPAELIIMPFRSFGHLLTHEDRMMALKAIHGGLAPGGEFVFDHYVIDEEWARAHDRLPQFMCKMQRADSGYSYVWDTYVYDFLASKMLCIVTVEDVSDKGEMESRHHQPFEFSWLAPESVRSLLLDASFEIVDLFGGFDRRQLDSASKDQIWHVRRAS